MMRLFRTWCIWWCLPMVLHAQYIFKEVSIDPYTKIHQIEDQGRTGTCWSFATASFLESEVYRMHGMAVDLSEMYFVYHTYLDKARNYVLRQGKTQFGEGSLAHDALRVLDQKGLAPEYAYEGRRPGETEYDHDALFHTLKGAVSGVVQSRRLKGYYLDAVRGILNAYLGSPPKAFPLPSTYRVGRSKGKSDSLWTTPLQWKEMLGLRGTGYVHLSSFTHHPYYSYFVLEVPDNWSSGQYFNLPLEELVEVAKTALKEGYTLIWDGDVSEPGFNSSKGLAILPVHPNDSNVWLQPSAEVKVSQRLRQRLFETLQTTDDHLMHIVGLVEDQEGTTYFLVKNSWGEKGPYRGYLYMSEAYFRAKTISITLHRNALPSDLKHRMQLGKDD